MAPQLASLLSAADLKNVPFDEVFLEYSYGWLNDPKIQELIDSKPVDRITQKVWFDGLSNRNDLFIWGLTFRDEPIGVFGLKNIINNEGEYWGYIGNKNYWGKGIGNWMMSRIFDLSKERDIYRIYLKVLPGNTRALNLYLKYGFAANELRQTNDKFIILDRNL